MSVSLKVDVQDRATSVLVETERLLQPAAVAKVAGRAGFNYVHGHFLTLDRTRPNKMGGERTHFFSQAARSTNFKSDASGANVSVNHVGIRQRIEGGVIKPREAQFLTIPATAAAYGTRAREWTLKFAYAEDSQGRKRKALVEPSTPEKAVFWLVPQAIQKPDGSIRPDLIQMKNSVVEAVERYVELERRRQTR